MKKKMMILGSYVLVAALSSFLSLLGGLIGMVLGLIVAAVVCNIISAPFHLSFFAIALGLGFSAAVGVIFGWMPAKKASELSPIDALRTE